MTGPSSSSQHTDISIASHDVLILAVAQWVWIGLIFAAVALGVIALARRA